MSTTPHDFHKTSGGITGLFNWSIAGKKKSATGSSSFRSRRSVDMADSTPAPASVSHASCNSLYGPPPQGNFSSLSTAPPPTNFSASADERTNDAELTSKVRLILRSEVKQIISENLIEMARLIMLPGAGDHEGGYVENPPQASGNSTDEQQLLRIKHLEMQLEESMQKQRKLQEEVETLKPERYELTSGSFAEGMATPPILQNAHDAMQSALLTCAVKVNEQVRAMLKIRSQKSTFIRQLCSGFFIDFEAASFGQITKRNPQNPIFQRPDKDLKRRLFKEYIDYGAVNETTLFNSEAFFKAFCSSRFQNLISNKNDSTPFAAAEQRKSILCQLLQSESCPLFVDFVRLAKTVWLLHKLAFAFEPTAEIFRVSEGCLYDPDYMEIRDADTESTKKKGAPQLIAFMAAPGFTVRNFIIKAHVHLKGE